MENIRGEVIQIGKQEPRRSGDAIRKVQKVRLRTDEGRVHDVFIVDQKELAAACKGKILALKGLTEQQGYLVAYAKASVELVNGNGQANGRDKGQPDAAKQSRFEKLVEEFEACLAQAKNIAGEERPLKQAILSMAITLFIYKQGHRSNGSKSPAERMKQCFDAAGVIGAAEDFSDEQLGSVLSTLFIQYGKIGFEG